MRSLVVGLLLLAPSAVLAGKPWHTMRDHTAFWSRVDSASTSAVIARELAIPRDGLAWAMEKGRKDAQFDVQPGATVLPPAGALETYSKLATVRTVPREDGPGFVVQYRDGGSWTALHTGDRAPLYAVGKADFNVVWDGRYVHVSGIATGSRTFQDHTILDVTQLLGPGDYWVGMVSEYLASSGSNLEFGLGGSVGGSRDKVYVLPVDARGGLSPGRPGLVLSLDLHWAEPENFVRAAWVRTDLDPPEWPEGWRERTNPHARFSAVAQVPVLEPFTVENLYIDVNLEPGVLYDDVSMKVRPFVGGEVSVGKAHWSAEILARPQLGAIAGWLHSRRRRPFDAGIGVVAGSWAGRAVPAIAVRLGFLMDVFIKLELEGMRGPRRAAIGGRIVVVDWNPDRKNTFTGGLFARASVAPPDGVGLGFEPFNDGMPYVAGGLALKYSHRKTWVSVK